jgi:hypothetical protein
MDKQAAREFIVRELGRHTNRNDILMALCKAFDIQWEDAESLMRDAETYDGHRIARKQSPLLIILGLGVIIGGLVLTIDAMMFFWDLTQMQGTEQLAYSQYSYIMGGSLITGIAMMAGGVIGFRRFISAVLR